MGKEFIFRSCIIQILLTNTYDRAGDFVYAFDFKKNCKFAIIFKLIIFLNYFNTIIIKT